MKNKLKGFTLIELIVVMAIFGFLMVGILSLVFPMSELFTKTAQTESVASVLDNTKRYIEGNLRYADRMTILEGTSPADAEAKITEFQNHFNLTVNDTVYMMRIRNGTDLDKSTIEKNDGKISITTYNGVSNTVQSFTADALDKNIFEDYALKISTGIWDLDTSEFMDGSIPNAKLGDLYLEHMTFTIAAYKERKNDSTYHYIEDGYTTANFACINMLNGNKVPVYDYDNKYSTNCEIIGYLYPPPASETIAYYGKVEDFVSDDIYIIYTLPKKQVDY